MMPRKTTKEDVVFNIEPLRYGVIKLRFIGTTPLMPHAMSAKAKHGLLLGTTKKTAAEKRGVIKHNPEDEYRECFYYSDDEESPTELVVPVNAIKAALVEAALETKGLTKASVQRLLLLPEQSVPLYGVPKLNMGIVRSSDIARTPDVRSRPVLEKWACEVTIQYILPTLSAHTVLTLAQNAGLIIGIMDFRQQKGKGNYGLWRVIDHTNDEDPEWNALTSNGIKEQQQEAINQPECLDRETAELMSVYRSEFNKRDNVK